MFQSSNTASGIWARQTSSACSPSSASTIWNSRPSRIRRATLRMTLESSTTKQVFITTSLYISAGSIPLNTCIPALAFQHLHSSTGIPELALIPTLALRPTASRSRRLGARADVEHPADVEDDHAPAVEAM